MTDSVKIQQFIERAKAMGLLRRSEAPEGEFPPFVFVVEGCRLATGPSVKDVNRLTKFAKESGLWPNLLDRLLALRIDRTHVEPSARVNRYEWSEMAPGAGNISFEEWTSKRKYQRRESSSTLVAVTASSPAA